MADAREAVDENKVLLGTTPGGKEIYLSRRPNCSVRKIAFGDGGKLPKQLEGGFSSVYAAMHATESYLAKVKGKEIKVDGTLCAGRK